MKNLFISLSLILFMSVSVYSQKETTPTKTNSNPPLDGVYEPNQISNREPIPWTSLVKKDVMWEKRIWRELDLRQKINFPLYFPVEKVRGRASLMQILYDGLREGTIHAYEDDDFLVELPYSVLEKTLNTVDTVPVFDSLGQITGMQSVSREFDPSKIKRFRMKEVWFFDKQKSILDVRILGLLPVQMVNKGEEGEEFAQTMFWFYFPECRNLFAKKPVFNVWNDAEVKSFDDIFWKRMFASYITKENNVYERVIKQYAKDLDALLESERIHDYIFNYEQDLWEY